MAAHLSSYISNSAQLFCLYETLEKAQKVEKQFEHLKEELKKGAHDAGVHDGDLHLDGIALVEWIRDQYKDKGGIPFPLYAYTSKAPYLLEGKGFDRIEKAGGKLLLKGRVSRRVEELRINEDMRRQQRVPRHVFLSYADVDAEPAEELHNGLVDGGLEVFMARWSIASGKVWSTEIKSALRRSRVGLVLLTAESVESKWVMAELGAFWILDIPFVPATIKMAPSTLPEFIKERQVINVGGAKGRKKCTKAIHDLWEQRMDTKANR